MSAALKVHRDVNVLTPDIKSVITGFGKHNRVLACIPSFDSEFGCVTLYARVDHVNGLRDPSTEEVLTVARKDQDVRGRFKLIETRLFDDGASTEFHFKRLNPVKGG